MSSFSYALDPFIKVKVLSRYSLDHVEVKSLMGRLRVYEKGGKIQEALWPPQLPLSLKVSDKSLELKLGDQKRIVEGVILDPPVGNFVTLKVGADLEKRFAGRLQIRNSKGALSFIEEIPLEEYVRGVLESEIPYGFPLEALKAQAVLIRTFALAHLDRHAKEGFSLCDLTHCQVYGGRNQNYRILEQAVKQTKSLILAYQFKPVEAVYHSTCGGHTSAFHQVFGGKEIPYLMGVSDQMTLTPKNPIVQNSSKDPPINQTSDKRHSTESKKFTEAKIESYCKNSPHSIWENRISLHEMSEILKKTEMNPKGEIQNMRISEQEPQQGRAFALSIEGKRHFEVRINQWMSAIGRVLGWSRIKSNWFEVKIENGEAVFRGHGLGHGVGLCQWGARGMAEAGKKFDEILFHYFPGTNLIEKE
ncbi:MAG: SpoIID/LytB domain-containing protein [Deltaproteobacteria bacterium]|nr:SpoIID/LytB domain-containing protein [Deltaproteobacteria bacterium]